MKQKTALWQLGFRPFFLFGSILSLIYMLIWALIQNTSIQRVGALAPMVWHGHEMIYGFAIAVVAGFVLTASQNWSGIRGVHGSKLKLLFALWLTARVLIIALPYDTIFTAVIDLSFLPFTGFLLRPYLKDVELRSERIFFIYFLVLMIGNTLVHTEALGITENTSTKGLLLGLNTIVLIILFMGGRVIPFFTESNLSKNQPKTIPLIEFASHISAWAFLFSQFFIPYSALSAIIAFIAGSFNLIRLKGWYVPRLRKSPIIWILHLAYFWICLGFIMTALSSLQLISVQIALHTFTVGGLGTIIYGMITRVSLGHTGRPLYLNRWIVRAYVLFNLSAITRVLIPTFLPTLYASAIQVSAVLWIVAFVLFIWIYGPMLIYERIDRREG